MAGVATLAALQTRLQNQGAVQHLIFNKPSSAGQVIHQPYFPLQITGGTPNPITMPVAGLGSAVATSSATAGTMPFSNAAASTNNFLFKVNWSRNNSGTVGGAVMIVDRLAHFTVAIDTASAAVSPALDATARLASGEGGLIMMQVTSALSAGSNTITLGYTNEAGTASRTTQVVTTVASRAVNLSAYTNNIFVPLASGDKGVRSIENWNLTGGTATGTVVVSVVKVLGIFSTGLYTDATNKELLVQGMCPVIVPNNAFLEAITINATSGSAVFNSSIEIFNN